MPRARYTVGTRIATVRGEVPVERLGVGDIVVTADDDRISLRAARRWDCDGRADHLVSCTPWAVWPVRVRAGAFGADRPRRDVLLGPDHAVLADGVLIPLRALLDGHTIRQVPMTDLTYWTLRFDRPEALLAEGLPVETHGPDGRDEGPGQPASAESSDEAPGHRPLVCSGLLVEAVRARIIRRRAA